MSNTVRTVGKRGLIPHDPSRYTPRLEDYIRGPLRVGDLPPANGTVDRCSLVTDWGVQGNDSWGNCVPCELIHADMAMSAYVGQPNTYTPEYGVTLYSAITGFDPDTGPPGDNPTDNGTAVQDALEFWKNTGLTDAAGKVHKIAGYARFGNPADEVLLGQVLEVFGCVIAGVSLQQAQEEQFSAGQVWDYQPGAGFIGGHGVTLQKRGVGGTGVLTYITWGQAQKATRAFQWNCCGPTTGEAWAVVSEDWVAVNGKTISGLDLDQLLADLKYVPQG